MKVTPSTGTCRLIPSVAFLATEYPAETKNAQDATQRINRNFHMIGFQIWMSRHTHRDDRHVRYHTQYCRLLPPVKFSVRFMINPADDPIFTICAVAAAIFIGLSKGGVPVIGMLGVPVLALMISPLRAAALLLPIYVVTDMFGLWAYRRQFSRRNLNILVPAAILGIAIGWMTAAIVPETLVALIVGLIGLGYCLDLWLKRKRTAAPRQADVPRGVFWGTLTGFTSFVSHSGAPPYQMYVMPQRLPKLVFAGTSTILFAIVNAVKLLPYWALGQLSMDNLETAAWLFPIGVIATLVGVRLVKVVSEELFYRVVIMGLFLVSAKLTIDGVRALLG
jgi:uncharacterized membrane protein YfcA